MRNRLEDLGRILVLAEKLTDHELFQGKYWSRPKEAVDWFCSQDEHVRDDCIHEIAYDLEAINNELCEIICIARGHDDLSEISTTCCKDES